MDQPRSANLACVLISFLYSLFPHKCISMHFKFCRRCHCDRSDLITWQPLGRRWGSWKSMVALLECQTKKVILEFWQGDRSGPFHGPTRRLQYPKRGAQRFHFLQVSRKLPYCKTCSSTSPGAPLIPLSHTAQQLGSPVVRKTKKKKKKKALHKIIKTARRIIVIHLPTLEEIRHARCTGRQVTLVPSWKR